MNKTQTGIRFQPDALTKMTYIAKQNHRSFNAQMEFLADRCIQEYEEQHGEIDVKKLNRYL